MVVIFSAESKGEVYGFAVGGGGAMLSTFVTPDGAGGQAARPGLRLFK